MLGSPSTVAGRRAELAEDVAGVEAAAPAAARRTISATMTAITMATMPPPPAMATPPLRDARGGR